MSEEVNDDGRLRKYLLGELPEAEQQALEERLMTEAELFDLLQVAEDELVDDHLSGALSASERSRFDGFFLSTPERRRKLSFAMAFRRYVTAEAAVVEAPATEPATTKPSPRISAGGSSVIGRATWWNRAFSSPYLRMAAAAVIVFALGLGIWRVFFYQSQIEKGMAALARAYSTERPVEARISGMDYAPFLLTRGGGPPRVDSFSLYRAERTLFDEAERRPSSELHHALGRLFLAEHKLDDAIRELDEALKTDPENARLHSDYGALLMEIAKKQNSDARFEMFARALEHVSKAVELDGSLLDALFNRALCRQEMTLFQQAEADWRAYLERDSVSRWADEARQKLSEIEGQRQKSSLDKEQLFQDVLAGYKGRDDEKAWRAFRRGRSRKGNFIIERLVDAFLALDAHGGTDEAEDNLRVLSYAGELETQKASDRSTSHLAQFYASTRSSQRVDLAQARSLIKTADEQSNKSEYAKAVGSYNEAKRVFDRLGDDCESRYATYRIAQCSLRQFGPKRSVASFERLAGICEQSNHKWLLALAYNSLADANNGLNKHSEAIHYSNQALEISEQIEDSSGIARCYLQIAIGHQKVNDYRKSLGFLQRGLLLGPDGLSDLSMLWIFYDVAAEAFRSLDLYAAALDFQNEALLLALDLNIPLNLSRSYAHLGFVYGKMRNYSEAIATAERAFEIGKTLSGDSIGREMMAYSSLYLGDLHRQKGEYTQALNYYDLNINIYASLDFPLHRYATHKGKLLCYIAQGDDLAAKNELETTLSLFERYRSTILEENNRNTFFDIEQDVYDTAIDFEYSRRNDPKAAFEKSEDSRARSLLDMSDSDVRLIDERFGPELVLSAKSQPLKLAEIQSRLPESAQIVQYAALEDKLLIWVVSKTVLSGIQEPVGIADLTEKVNAYVEKVSQPSEDPEKTTREAESLYDLLISPIEPLLDKTKYTCIVPDKVLNRLPFVALVSRDGEYLVKDYLVGVCPSSTIFVKRSETARSKESQNAESLFVLGNPSFDRTAFPSLEDLSSSGREAEAVAALYHSSPLTGSNAREELVRRKMTSADVIHIATHYVADKRSHLFSAFLLAREPDARSGDSRPDGQLQIHEIFAMKLSRPRLAVLAACQTGAEKTYRGEGAISVARPFIAAGVPVVVASLWPVESQSTSTLMVSFHRHRKGDGLSTANALRQAQLDVLNNPDVRFHHPYYWASFAVIGGFATF